MEKLYRQQVSLLLSVLPEVAKEKCFALHGGTAINLFVRNMPRLSVDIDLTYLPIAARTAGRHALRRARAALVLIAGAAAVTLPAHAETYRNREFSYSVELPPRFTACRHAPGEHETHVMVL